MKPTVVLLCLTLSVLVGCTKNVITPSSFTPVTKIMKQGNVYSDKIDVRIKENQINNAFVYVNVMDIRGKWKHVPFTSSLYQDKRVTYTINSARLTIHNAHTRRMEKYSVLIFL